MRTSEPPHLGLMEASFPWPGVWQDTKRAPSGGRYRRGRGRHGAEFLDDRGVENGFEADQRAGDGYAVDNPMIEHQAHRTTLVGTDHSISQKHRRHGDRMDEFGAERRYRRHHESSEIVAALPTDAKAKPPKQPTQRPRQFRDGKHAAEVPDLVQRRLFGVADHLRKIADAAGRRILDHARQTAGSP